MNTVFRFPLRLLALLACTALLVYACKDDDDVLSGNNETTTITGTIVNSEGHIVPGAILEVHDSRPSIQAILASDTTDEEGTFTLSKIPAGTDGLFFRVTHPHYEPLVDGLGRLKNSVKDGHARLSLLNNDSCCGILALTVVDTANPGGVDHVQIKLRSGHATLAVAFTDTLGRVVFRNVCEGEYNVRLAKDGYRVVEEDIVVEECDSVGLVIAMPSSQNNNGADSCCHGVAAVVVRDSTTSAALGGTTVKLWKGNHLLTTLTTNGDGLARFTGLCPGEYQISILREGYYSRELNFEAGCNDTLELTPRILTKNTGADSCCHGNIFVIVRDSATGAVLTGAKVKLWKGNQLKAQETSGQNGVYFANLCNGNYGISIFRDGYKAVEYDVELGCNDTLELTGYMLNNGTPPDTCCNNRVKVVVRDSTTNQPLKNATVKFWKNGQIFKTKTTNADGVVVLEELCHGEYGVSVIREGYVAREFTVEVDCGDNIERTIRLFGHTSNADSCCHGMLKMIVRDSTTNNALGSTLVKLWKGNEMVAVETTNGDGYVIFHNLCPGNYWVGLIREHYNNREFPIEFGCNDTLVQTRRLLAKQNNGNDTCETAKLKVRVKDSTQSTWLAGATVVIKRNGAVVAEGTTDAEGWYLREHLLAPAEYSVTFSKQGYVSKTLTFFFNECKTIQETVRLVED